MRLALSALVLAGCSSLLGLEEGDPLEPDAGVDPPVLPDAAIVTFEMFVSPMGNDANDGTIGNPVRSLTRAAELSGPGSLIHVAGGTYDEVDGENFPITFGPGVEIVGDRNGTPPTQINGVVSVPLIELGSSSLSGIVLTNSGDGVTLTAGGRITNSDLTATVPITAPSSSFIEGNTVQGCNTGILLTEDSGGAVGSLTRNFVVDCGIGVDVTVAGTVDIGPDNDFTCSTNADFRAQGGGTVNADSNRWDHIPPSSGNLGGGIDTTTLGGSTINATNPTLTVSPCP